MRKEFYGVYKDLYEIYARYYSMPEEWFPFIREPWLRLADIRSVRWVTESIEQAISDLNLADRLRPDARYFLLVNLHQMVALPLIHPKVKDLDFGQLEADLKSDARTILSAAIETSEGGQEITASGLLKVISSQWDKLRVTAWEVWG